MMKKLLTFIIVCLSCSMMYAQNQTHWTPVPVGEKTMICTCVILINGEEQKNPDLEIGVFSNDGECRGAKIPLMNPKTGRWVYQLVIKGTEGFTYTFKVFNHETQQELALTSKTSLDYKARAIIGKAMNPFVVDFTSEESSSEIKSMKNEKN